MPILFLKKYWRMIVFAFLLAISFTMGTRWAGFAYEKQRAEQVEAAAAALVQREQEIRAEYNEQLEVDQEARFQLQKDLLALRAREASLLDEIENLKLVKPVSTVIVEGCTEDEEIIANPFTDDFVRLWNDAGRNNPTE